VLVCGSSSFVYELALRLSYINFAKCQSLNNEKLKREEEEGREGHNDQYQRWGPHQNLEIYLRICFVLLRS
jgi:hypothetical protein